MKMTKFFVLATAAASVCAFSAHAQTWVPPEILLTEVSDTTLTATITVNGVNNNQPSPLTVIDIGPDNWFVSGFGTFLINGHAQWSEPDASGEVNSVTSSLDSSLDLGLAVHSDVDFSSDHGPLFGNNVDDKQDFNYLGATFLGVNVTFNDLGDSATVPDAATTMPLLGFAAGGLFGLARRFRK
ncbi:MAG TPA: hypothetical protein VGO67_16310 [Verrucomicrobiae bacterium]|jgi:hypothetical protein